jgi:hypothetical protein
MGAGRKENFIFRQNRCYFDTCRLKDI